MYFQDVRGKKGSPSHTSMAHQEIGIRTQLMPAPAISAKSCSVLTGNVVKGGRSECAQVEHEEV